MYLHFSSLLPSFASECETCNFTYFTSQHWRSRMDLFLRSFTQEGKCNIVNADLKIKMSLPLYSLRM